jgi:hypothetical protein
MSLIPKPMIWTTLPTEMHSSLAALWAELLRRHLGCRRGPEEQVHHEHAI